MTSSTPPCISFFCLGHISQEASSKIVVSFGQCEACRSGSKTSAQFDFEGLAFTQQTARVDGLTGFLGCFCWRHAETL